MVTLEKAREIFGQVLLTLKEFGMVNFAVILAGVGIFVKICHLYPTMAFLPGRKSRKTPLPKGRIIGHRGSCTEGVPENTLMSFLDAIDAGCDILELDVWLTKDKKIVVHHDKSLARMTSGTCTADITDLKFSDLPDIYPPLEQRHRIEKVCNRYANGLPKLGIDSDSMWKKIPTLEQVLDAIPDSIGLIVEVKDGQDDMCPLLHKTLKSRSKVRLDNTYWFSLNDSIFNRLRMQDPSIFCCTPLLNIIRVVFLYMLGLLPFIDVKCDTFGIDMRAVTKERVYNDVIFKSVPSWLKDILIFIFRGGGGTPYIFLHPKLYSLLRKRGIPTYFLGVNDIKNLQIAIKHGAAAVLTDKPNFLCSYVKQNGVSFIDVQTHD